MLFTKDEICNLEKGTTKEWLLTNGIGGFAAGTVLSSNSRRYHGLLFASYNPPVDRKLVISNLHEIIEFDNDTSYLSSFECGTNYVGKGFKHIEAFEYNNFPVWHYEANGMAIEKMIFMIHGQNTTVVRYKVKNGKKRADFKVYPLINFRDYHGERTDFSSFKLSYGDGFIKVGFDNTKLDVKLISKLKFCEKRDIFYNMYYRKEAERGLNSVENHFMPGAFTCSFEPFEEKQIDFVLTTEDNIEFDIDKELKKENARISRIIKKAGLTDEFQKSLVKAADAFIVDRKSTKGKTIIAGYPWFTDWGRDTLIALTGLTLVTKRFEDAKSILKTFAKYIKDGLLPNVFPDVGENPGYNTVDAPMWFFEAVYNYIKYTDDNEFLEFIYPKLKEVFDRYSMSKEEIVGRNTEYIYMDSDNLIYSGNESTQLTWMDAKVGDYVVTPRHGKAVEINALWYNAAMIMDKLSKKVNDKYNYLEFAKKIKKSYMREFWYKEGKYLYDIVRGEERDASIRPNQILTFALNFPILTAEKAKSVFNVVANHLYTPVGLRSLSFEDEKYRGIYIGDIWSRDTAYHQGTVWTWPMGAFISASKRLKIKGEYAAESIIENIQYHLKEETLGQISEIFDGNVPYTPRGCFAQAWSIAEILRSTVENY